MMLARDWCSSTPIVTMRMNKNRWKKTAGKRKWKRLWHLKHRRIYMITVDMTALEISLNKRKANRKWIPLKSKRRINVRMATVFSKSSSIASRLSLFMIKKNSPRLRCPHLQTIMFKSKSKKKSKIIMNQILITNHPYMKKSLRKSPRKFKKRRWKRSKKLKSNK